MRIFLLFAFLLTITLSACKSKPAKKQEKEVKENVVPDSTTVVAPARDSVLLNLSANILTAFKNKDYTTLASFIHPDEGIRFSPYGFIDTLHDKIVHAGWIKGQTGSKKQEKVLWGEFDGTGDPIRMTLDEYVKRFVYDAEFLKPEKSSVNRFLGAGNSANNLAAIYPGCDFTEAYFSGIDKRYEGIDWRSLRLVFRLKEDRFYLVAVVHDEWTI